jgi:hypothetical protein
MSKRKPKIIEEASRLDVSSGYHRDGVSLYSHAAAQGHAVPAPPEQPPRWRTVSELIGKNKNQLKKIEERLRGELTRERRALLESDREIKNRFLKKLLAEQDDMIRRGASHV